MYIDFFHRKDARSAKLRKVAHPCGCFAFLASSRLTCTNPQPTHYSERRLSSRAEAHSERRLFTGFINAAFIA